MVDLDCPSQCIKVAIFSNKEQDIAQPMGKFLSIQYLPSNFIPRWSKSAGFTIRVPIAVNRQLVHQLLITCVGLVIDTVRMIVKIPEDKFEKLEFGISLILNSKKYPQLIWEVALSIKIA
jgi:hypothetical protein